MRRLDLPIGWTEGRLDELAERGSGHTPDKERPEFWNGGIKWVSLSDGSRLDRGYINDTEKKISALGIRHSSAVIHPRGTVILLRDAHIGRCAILGDDMAVSQHFIAWRCPEAGPLLSEFLYYQLQSRKREFERVANGSTILTIGLSFFKSFRVRYPSRPEQDQIARLLSAWDEAIERLTKLIVAKGVQRDHLQGKLVSLARWSTCPIGDVVRSVSRPEPTPTTAYAALGIRSHGKGTFQRVIERPEEIGMDTVYAVGPRDLIVNITFAWEGAIALAKPKDAGCFVSHRFPTFEISEDKIDREFLGYAVKTRRFFHHLGIASPGGAGRNRVLNKVEFLKIEIPFPTMEVQKKISESLGAAEQEIDLLKRERDMLEKEKRGLMQKLLTGEWRVPIRDGEVAAVEAAQ